MKIGCYLYFETETNYDNAIASTHYAGGLIQKPQTFPAYLKYVSAFEPGCCGDWVECQPEELIKAINMKINNYKLEIFDLKNLLKRIKNP